MRPVVQQIVHHRGAESRLALKQYRAQKTVSLRVIFGNVRPAVYLAIVRVEL